VTRFANTAKPPHPSSGFAPAECEADDHQSRAGLRATLAGRDWLIEPKALELCATGRAVGRPPATPRNDENTAVEGEPAATSDPSSTSLSIQAFGGMMNPWSDHRPDTDRLPHVLAPGERRKVGNVSTELRSHYSLRLHFSSLLGLA